VELVVASIFRNAAHYVERYFRQLEALSDEGSMDVTVVVAEGDSQDDTYGEIERWITPNDVLLKADHGGPHYGSIDHPGRWKQIAWVCNQVMDALPNGLPVIYVESDLIWMPHTMLTLLDDLEEHDAVAPLSLHHDVFYDVWGYRGSDGERFEMHEPYHSSLETKDRLVPINSAGSCIAMRPEIAKVARFAEEDCIVGLCRSIREHGDLYLDTTVAVQHP